MFNIQKETCTMYAPKSKRCNALTSYLCNNGKCKFYKSIEKYPRENYLKEVRNLGVKAWS